MVKQDSMNTKAFHAQATSMTLSSVLLMICLCQPGLVLAEMPDAPAVAADMPLAEPMTDETAVAPLGRVTRSAFTQTIVAREPQDQIISLANDQDGVYYFTEIRDMSGQEITHRWLYNDRVMAEISFHIGSNRWRVWSKKRLASDWTGVWTVEVVDQAGTIIHSDNFTYTPVEPL